MQKFETNYLKRKVLLISLLVLLSLMFIFQLVMIKKFFAWIEYEYQWIQAGELSKTWKIDQVENNAPAFQLKTLFLSLNSIFLVLTFSAIVLVSLVIYTLFKNTYNGDLYLKIVNYLVPIVFVLLFFILSLQPTEVYQENIIQAEDDAGEIRNTPFKKSGGQLSYLLTWLALGFSFINIFLIVIARKSFGFLTKDQILAKQLIPTDELKIKIQTILDNN